MTQPLTPFDYVKNINTKSGVFLDEEVNSSYESFVINRAFSNIPETVFFASALNGINNVSKVMQYHFLYYGLDKKNRFGKWHKAEIEEDISVIMEYYGYSYQKAKEVFPILVNRIDILKQDLMRGGKDGKYRTN